MSDAATSNTLLGLFGPMAVLAAMALNTMLLWSRRHSFTDALLGRGFSAHARVTIRCSKPQARSANVVPFGRTPPVSRGVQPLRAPAARLAA